MKGLNSGIRLVTLVGIASGESFKEIVEFSKKDEAFEK